MPAFQIFPGGIKERKINRRTFKFCPRCSSKLQEEEVEDRRRFLCKSCGWVNYENPLPSVAAMVRNEQGDILLIRRGIEPGLGEWALPSGFIEIDETPEMACVRELEEETGLLGRITGLIGVFSQKSSMYKNVLIIGYSVEGEGLVRAGSDSQEARFFSIDEMPEIAFPSHLDMIQAGLKGSSL
jgi:8-oxo-dGTP diphosphatase